MICDKECDYCIYSTLMCDPCDESTFTACDYIGVMKKPRPCHAGPECTVKQLTPVQRFPGRRGDTERQRLNRAHVRNVCQGEQGAVIIDFMQREGYTRASLAEKLRLNPSAIKGWVLEYNFANWKELEKIGLKMPEGMPTQKTHPLKR